MVFTSRTNSKTKAVSQEENMCQINQNILFVFLPALIFAIPKPIEIDTSSSTSTYIGHLKTLSHEVSGELHATDNERVLEIKNFNYDGKYSKIMLRIGARNEKNNNAKIICVRVDCPNVLCHISLT